MHNLPPAPRFTLLGNWSLLKSCVSLKTATGAAWGTSENSDIFLYIYIFIYKYIFFYLLTFYFHCRRLRQHEDRSCHLSSWLSEMKTFTLNLDLVNAKWAWADLPIEIVLRVEPWQFKGQLNKRAGASDQWAPLSLDWQIPQLMCGAESVTASGWCRR